MMEMESVAATARACQAFVPAENSDDQDEFKKKMRQRQRSALDRTQANE